MKEIYCILIQAFTADGKIQNYQIIDGEITKNPMGGIIVYLDINGESDFNVSVFLHRNPETGKLESTGGSWSKQLQDYVHQEK